MNMDMYWLFEYTWMCVFASVCLSVSLRLREDNGSGSAERFLFHLTVSLFLLNISCFLHLHVIVEGFYFHCSLSVFVCVCMCVCVCVRLCLWTIFHPNGCTDLDAVFAKRLLITLARTFLNFVTLGQRSRSQWLIFFKLYFYRVHN